MASKKKNELTYGQLPLPEGRKAYKMTKRSWSGLNKRQTIDTGALSMENNISTSEAPYLTPSPRREIYWASASGYRYLNPISMFGFDDFLLIIYFESNKIKVDYITEIKKDSVVTVKTYTGVMKEAATEQDIYPRSVVQFNVYDTPTDPLTGKYIKKLLIFPDKMSMDFEIAEDDFEINSLDVEVKEYTNDVSPYLPPDDADQNYYWKNTYNQDVYRWVEDETDNSNSGWKISVPPGGPAIKYATVHQSRVFGVDDDRVYASGYNDYANWNLDTVNEYNESNAWCSPAQSNTKAGGAFTGITTFQGHVICFKRDYMHELYNTKNPFRIQDIFAEGAVDNRTIQDVDGRLIFVSDDNVKIYTGSNPRIISYYLNMQRYVNPVSGTDGRNYYLYCEDPAHNMKLFVYDTIVEQWSERAISEQVLNFAHNKNGMYALCNDGNIYKIDTNNYTHPWSCETDLITNETVDIKHIKKIQLFAHIKSTTNLKVYILYADNKKPHLVYSSGERSGQVAIRVKPRQTADYGFKLRFEGEDYARLYELELIMESGGNLYV